MNIQEGLNSDNETWQRIALINGWNTWDLNVTPDDLETAREEIEIIKSERKASTSFLQRKLQIGYNRAARIIDQMEANGEVSVANHVGKREILK